MLHRCRKQLISGFAALLTLLTLIAVQMENSPAAHASYTVTILPAQQYQTIQGWGTSMAWWANIIGGWSNSQRVALANALYDPDSGLGLNVVRYNFGADGPGNVCHDQMREGGNVPSFEPTQGNYVWTNDANQMWFAQAARARGANVFEGFVNSAPAWMLKNSCTAGGPNGAENISPDHYNDFASYIATIAKHFHDNAGITLQTVDPFNEPSGTWWNSTNRQEGMFVSQSTQNVIIPLVQTALEQNGASAYTVVSAPDDVSVGNSVSAYNSYAGSTKADLGQWNTHTYGGSDSDRATAYINIAQNDHKRLWMSEWGTGAQGTPIAAALRLSRAILEDEQYLHPASWVAWQAVNEAGDTPDSLWGLAYRGSDNSITYPSRYYAMGNYSKFVRPGYKMIGNNDANNTFTAYDARSHKLVIVATNNATSSNTVTYNLSNFSSVGGSATPYQTSASQNLQQIANVKISNKTFSSTLPAQSITTFVIPGVTYEGSASSGNYKLVNRNSGKLLEVQGSSTTNGGLIDQWNDNGGANQQWSLVPAGSGYMMLVNRNSGKVLDVAGFTTADGGKVDQWAANGGTNQQWNLVQLSDGYYKLVNRNSGKLLEVQGSSTADGGLVDQWTDNGGANQEWSLVQLP
ncbi:MAG: RICIN domain-containing protein [Ktedonobacteraceae bacterium]|nr:RICIN domain-containing protein [Ktedonobacteraceae bacterium]